MPPRISKENEQYIIENYYYERTKDILKKLKISKPTLLRYVKKSGLIIKTSKLYDCDENFFENIDTEEKAYWLGFLYADGYVRNRKNNAEMKLKLSVKDIEHLNKFKNVLKSNSEIRISENQATLYICQKNFVKNLIDKGCFQAKTFTIKFPTFLREDLKRHFIRGYFDGDGSISQWTYVHKRKNRKDRIETNQQFEITSGSMSILESIKKEILESCKVKNYKICTSKNKHYHRVAWWSKNDIKLIFHYFYDNSNIFLERKKRKFLDIC